MKNRQKISKKLLTKKKAKWAENRDVTLRGTNLNYNASQQRKYVKALQALVQKLVDETHFAIRMLLRSETADDFFDQQQEVAAMDAANLSSTAKKVMNKLKERFARLFGIESTKLADDMYDRTSKASEVALKASLKQLSGGLTLNTGVSPPGMGDVHQAIIDENVSLIKSIPQQFLTQVGGAVMRSITDPTGESGKKLLDEILKHGNVSYRRAKNIALDQTRKAYNAINKQRMQAIGVKQFVWQHSFGGQKPRESHVKISGHIFSFENLQQEQADLDVPPEDRGIPGFPINCRCTMNPVIKFD